MAPPKLMVSATAACKIAFLDHLVNVIFMQKPLAMSICLYLRISNTEDFRYPNIWHSPKTCSSISLFTKMNFDLIHLAARQ